MTDVDRIEQSFEDRTIRQLGDLLRSPDAHIGGAAAAAASASLAAATAALVTILSARRGRNRDRRGEIEHDTGNLHELQRQLLVAGEADERALDALMRLYRSKSDTKEDETAYGASLMAAAESSIEIGRLAGKVCELAARQTGHASRFTVSDLGAAAAMARGAVTAALLTAEVNILMLRELPSIPTGQVERLAATVAEIDAKSSGLARNAIEETRSRVSPRKDDSAS